jgi:hypothetical protein
MMRGIAGKRYRDSKGQRFQKSHTCMSSLVSLLGTLDGWLEFSCTNVDGVVWLAWEVGGWVGRMLLHKPFRSDETLM